MKSFTQATTESTARIVIPAPSVNTDEQPQTHFSSALFTMLCLDPWIMAFNLTLIGGIALITTPTALLAGGLLNLSAAGIMLSPQGAQNYLNISADDTQTRRRAQATFGIAYAGVFASLILSGLMKEITHGAMGQDGGLAIFYTVNIATTLSFIAAFTAAKCVTKTPLTNDTSIPRVLLPPLSPGMFMNWYRGYAGSNMERERARLVNH